MPRIIRNRCFTLALTERESRLVLQLAAELKCSPLDIFLTGLYTEFLDHIDDLSDLTPNQAAMVWSHSGRQEPLPGMTPSKKA